MHVIDHQILIRQYQCLCDYSLSTIPFRSATFDARKGSLSMSSLYSLAVSVVIAGAVLVATSQDSQWM